MYRKQMNLFLFQLALIAALLLSGCSTLIEPVTVVGTAPTPVISVIQGGVENPDVYVDPDEFKAALLAAIAAREPEKLEMWMAEPFLTGTWRADLTEKPAVDALQALYTSETGADRQLALVEDVDLQALMGGSDPLSLPGNEAGVIEAALVSGWGQDGLDEAVLFIARRPDNSLRWQGWLRIPGGFNGARFGGVKAYQNDALGFRFYLPKDYQVDAISDQNISINAPAVEGAGHPGNASIQIEPANGRTAEAAARLIYADVKETSGKWVNVSITSMRMDDTTAYLVTGIPSQSLSRQLFMVHNDWLYRIYFAPDEPQQAPVSYTQMENLYAMITNTFDFTK
jgi:hypothetical protein